MDAISEWRTDKGVVRLVAVDRATPERDSDEVLDQAWRHLDAEDYPHAERLCRRVLADHPTSANALHLLGLVAFRQGNLTNATKLIRRAIRQRPKVPGYHHSHGLVLLASMQPAASIVAFRRALSLQPGFGEARRNLGKALRTAGFENGAEGALRHAGYEITEFGEDGTLRVPAAVWWVLLLLNRHALAIVIGSISVVLGRRFGLEVGALHQIVSNPFFLLASLPAMLVFAANFKRIPEGSKGARWIWKRGRALLIAAAVLDLALLGWTGWSEAGGTFAIIYWLGAVIDLGVIAFLARSGRVVDVFSDFPRAPQGPPPVPADVD